MADHLVEGEPYLALNAIVLDARAAAQLRLLTETFSAAFDYAVSKLRLDPSGLVAMGFPWVAAELLAAEPLETPLIGRFDFVCDEHDHWWLLEFNADTPSGVREAIVVDEIAHRLLPSARGLIRPSAGLHEAIVGAFCEAVRGLPPGRALGLVTDASELEDLAQMAFMRNLLAEPLARLGIDVVLGDADNLRATRAGLTLCGRRLGGLYRYLPFESMLGTPAFPAIFDAVANGNLRLLNGLGGLLRQHKGLLAWLYAHRKDTGLDAAQRRSIGEHLPGTWPIDGYPADRHQASLVAKQVFGREGEEVFFGEDVPASSWEILRRRHTYVAQQRVNVSEIDAAVPTSSGPERMRGRATVGCYAVRGRWAGFYTRFGGKITTSRAKWLATFVEEAG
jgi:glutathionylspermidine synthase